MRCCTVGRLGQTFDIFPIEKAWIAHFGIANTIIRSTDKPHGVPAQIEDKTLSIHWLHAPTRTLTGFPQKSGCDPSHADAMINNTHR